jgi:hypothetical protein
MSEQNPFAPVGTPGVLAPPPAMVPPQGFAPPPLPGFQPPPVAHEPYQSAGMALTELSFAPLPTEVAPAPAAPPPPVSDSLVTNVLPSGGVARRLSLGGRLPMIALVLVVLLGAAGAAYSTGILGGKAAKPAPVVPHKKAPVVAPKTVVPSAPAVVAPVKPAPKPVVKPLIGKTLSVTKANSHTYGGAYSLTVPTGWVSQLKVDATKDLNGDVAVGHKRTGQALLLGSVPPAYAKGPLTAATLSKIKAQQATDNPTAKFLPGTVKATIAGRPATGFDMTDVDQGVAFTARFLTFERNGVLYDVVWTARSAAYGDSLTTFNQLLASVKFAK